MERSHQGFSSRLHAKLAAAEIVGLILVLGCAREPARPAVPEKNQSPTPTTISKPEPLPSSSSPSALTVTSDGVDLGMVYYVNYGRDVSGPPWSPVGGLGSRGWNDISYENLWTGFVTNRPALGFYNSADPNVIDSHLRQMDAIGVDFLLISYLG